MVQDTSYSQEIYIGITKSNTKWSLHRYGGDAPADSDVQSPSAVLDERNNIYVTSIPGWASWLSSPETLESLSLNEDNLLKGDKSRIPAHGQREFGVLLKCYNRAEDSLKVCDLIEVIGILDVPEDMEDAEDSREVAIHAVTIQKRHLNDIVVSKYGRLSQGMPSSNFVNVQVKLQKRKIYSSNMSQASLKAMHLRQS